MPNVEIIDTLYENMCEHIEVLKKKYPHKSHTIKDFVNISIKEKIDTDKISIELDK